MITRYLYTRSVNARFARCIVGQSNFTCPFQIDQSQSLEVTISSPTLFCIGYDKRIVVCYAIEVLEFLFKSYGLQKVSIICIFYEHASASLKIKMKNIIQYKIYR